MSRNLCINSSAPPFFPLLNQPIINTTAAGAGAPAVAAPVVIWNENPLTGNFNPGTVAGQKIFLEKTKGLATAGQLPLSNTSATKIMFFFQYEITAHGNCCHRSPNCVYIWNWKLTNESHSPGPLDPT